jgi:RHS repeat-associated protein
VAEFAYAGTDQPIARITGNSASDTVHYYAQDAVGNVIAQWTGDSIEQHLAYDPWGAATVTPSVKDTTQLRWKGLLYETGVTSLYYVRARWYDPVTRRFVSADPLGLSAGVNQYAFAGGDPVNGRDPSGMDCTDPDDGDDCDPDGGGFTAGSGGGNAGGPSFTCQAGDTGGGACLAAAQQFVYNLALDPSNTENLDFSAPAPFPNYLLFGGIVADPDVAHGYGSNTYSWSQSGTLANVATPVQYNFSNVQFISEMPVTIGVIPMYGVYIATYSVQLNLTLSGMRIGTIQSPTYYGTLTVQVPSGLALGEVYQAPLPNN